MSEGPFIQNLQRSLNSEKVNNSIGSLRQFGQIYGSNQYLSMVESAIPLLQFYSRELEANGIPAYYSLIPIVESRNRPDAISPKGASGVWQLMPDTAMNYGAQLNQFIDERQSIVQSTKYASRFLKYLLTQFDEPIYVLAAYNWGPANVTRIKSTFLYPGQLLSSPMVPMETKNYVKSILSYWESIQSVSQSDRLMNYPNVNYLIPTYGGPRNDFGDSKITSQLNLSTYSGQDRLVPSEYFEQYFHSLPIQVSPRMTPNMIPTQARNNVIRRGCYENEEGVSYQIYVVSQQDNAETISRKFRVPTTEFLKRIPSATIRPGKVLMIPEKFNTKECY